jgi:hypothetical protein
VTELRVQHRVAVEIAIFVKTQIVHPHPKYLGLERLNSKVEDKAACTNFSLAFARVIVHSLAFVRDSLAFGRWLQFRLVTLDRMAPIFGMEFREGVGIA